MEKGLESSRKEIEQLKTWIAESDNIVFFGGAGVSTESNIPDFRSEDGLYQTGIRLSSRSHIKPYIL